MFQGLSLAIKMWPKSLDGYLGGIAESWSMTVSKPYQIHAEAQNEQNYMILTPWWIVFWMSHFLGFTVFRVKINNA